MSATAPSTLTTIVTALGAVGAVGGMAGVAALFNARATRRKTDAEAEKAEAEAADKITDAALKIVTPLQSEVARQAGVIAAQQATITGVTTRVGQLESDARTQHMLLVEHSVWDHLALARLAENGVEMNPIPPLFHRATQPTADA